MQFMLNKRELMIEALALLKLQQNEYDANHTMQSRCVCTCNDVSNIEIL